MTIVIDTDALVGLANADDSHHTQALRLAEELITRQASIHILPTTLAEFALVATTKIGLARSQKAAHHVRARYALMDVQGDITDEALNLYAKQTSKENSLFDCYAIRAGRERSVQRGLMGRLRRPIILKSLAHDAAPARDVNDA